MADEEKTEDAGGGGGGGAGGDGGEAENAPKCPECPPAGLPLWMATFSDMVTLLMTFFVLLLSFAKTETNKYEAAMGSIRNAFGGNVLKRGEVMVLGKSPDDEPVILDAKDPLMPFPIEFLTMEGLLDKYEINRESDEDLDDMKKGLKQADLAENATIYEMPEGVKVRMKDKIYFKKGSTEIDEISVKVFEKLIKLIRQNDWTVFVEGHASRGETSPDGMDALMLSSQRATAVTKALIRRGVRPQKITTVFYGDTREIKKDRYDEQDAREGRRVEFILRKIDLKTKGHEVHSQ